MKELKLEEIEDIKFCKITSDNKNLLQSMFKILHVGVWRRIYFFMELSTPVYFFKVKGEKIKMPYGFTSKI
jgi:hypothetical protein